MANISSTSLASWSTTEASNQPDTTDSNTIVGDLRAIQAGVRNAIAAQDTIASASTTDIGAKAAYSLAVSGVTTITALGTIAAGIRKLLKFDGVLTLTHNGTSLILPGAASITTAANDTAEFESLGSGNWRCNWYKRQAGTPFALVDDSVVTAKIADDAVTAAKLASDVLLAEGQCRLIKDGSNLKLIPYNGNKIVINGALETIPDAGVTLAATGLTAGFYYIYAYMNTGTMTLEASTTARATSTTAGNKGTEIKSGDDTRSLVGAAYSTTSTWTDTTNSRSVISWFNRRLVTGRASLSTNRTTTSTSIAEINSEARVYFLTWSDEAVAANANGTASNSAAFQSTNMAIGWDGVSVLGGFSRQANTTATSVNSVSATSVAAAGQLTEAALHYVVLGGAVSANTGTFYGGADNADRCEINIVMRG